MFNRLGLQMSGGSNDYAYNWYFNDVWPNPYPVFKGQVQSTSTLPSVPPSTTITSLYYGYNQVTLNWSSITGEYIFIIQYSTDDINWTTFTTLSVSQTTTTVTGLTNDTTYYFRIGVSDLPTTSIITYSTSASVKIPLWLVHDLVPNTSLTTGNTPGVTTVIVSGTSSSATTVTSDIFNRKGVYNVSASSILSTLSQPSFYPYLVFETTYAEQLPDVILNNNQQKASTTPGNPSGVVANTSEGLYAFWNSGGNRYNTTGAYTGSVSTSVVGIGNIAGEWLQVQAPFATVMKNYSMSARVFFGYRMPKIFYIVGSHDGSSWYYVDQRTIATQWNDASAPTTAKSFTVSTTNTSSLTAYTYFRLIVNSVENGGAGPSNAQQVNIYTFVPVCYMPSPPTTI